MPLVSNASTRFLADRSDAVDKMKFNNMDHLKTSRITCLKCLVRLTGSEVRLVYCNFCIKYREAVWMRTNYFSFWSFKK